MSPHFLTFGFHVNSRLYGPLQQWIDKTWKAAVFDLVKSPRAIWEGSVVGLPSAPRNLGLKADRTIWRVGGIYKSGILDVEAKNEGTLREQ
jgi:hypothetical protein